MRQPSQTGSVRSALVLAGGGLTGVVYEIGALRAVNDVLLDRSVNDFDIYVGTSAGALVASMLANGLSPERMLASFTGQGDIPPIKRAEVFAANYPDLLKMLIRLPGTGLGAARHYL